MLAIQPYLVVACCVGMIIGVAVVEAPLELIDNIALRRDVSVSLPNLNPLMLFKPFEHTYNPNLNLSLREKEFVLRALCHKLILVPVDFQKCPFCPLSRNELWPAKLHSITSCSFALKARNAVIRFFDDPEEAIPDRWIREAWRWRLLPAKHKKASKTKLHAIHAAIAVQHQLSLALYNYFKQPTAPFANYQLNHHPPLPEPVGIAEMACVALLARWRARPVSIE